MNPSRRLAAIAAAAILAAAAARAPAQGAAGLSEEATVSLLTLWPGNEIYLAFGHSALRVRDPARNLDRIFNYGTFTFTDPLFIPKFVRGDLRYFLAAYPFRDDFDFDRRTENRQWYEQVLNLDRDQVNALYRFLLNNVKPQNRYYRYDFILDNCATRIRDALGSTFGADVQFDPGNQLSPRKSYRAMIDECVADRPFYRFMFYTVLGTAADREVTSYQSQFLPLYMMRVFERSTIVRNGAPRPLVASAGTLYVPPAAVRRGLWWANPSFVIWPVSLLALILTARGLLRLRKRGKPTTSGRGWRAFDAALFLVTGLMGCLAFYLTVFSVHAAAQGNLSLFWLLPTNIAAAVFLMRRRPLPRWLSWYFAAAAALAVVPLLCWPFWPQRMHPAMVPFMLTIAARGLWSFLAARGFTSRRAEATIPDSCASSS
jgi:hypothetical protein